MPFYPSVNVGTNKISALSDGYTINVSWYQAGHTDPTKKIAYHIYYSTVKENVFTEGVKYVSIDNALQANLIDLTPGQMYFVAVRPVEYDPLVFNLNNLPIAYDNLRVYPSSVLRADITATDLTIPLLDASDFLPAGFIKIGAELAQYSSVDYLNNNLSVPAPGGGAVNASLIDQGGGNYWTRKDGYVGEGIISTLTLLDFNTISQDWYIKCVFVQRDISNNPISGTAKFISIGSISGVSRDGYAEPIVWMSDGYTVSNGIFGFKLIDSTPVFRQGDEFLIKISGAVEGGDGGRGYENSVARPHTVAGFDGYNMWNPLVINFTAGESQIYDRIFACQSRFEYPNYQYTATDGYHQVIKDLLSTDLSAADADNVDFPSYDYAGYHRTDPVQLLNGTCVGSYIGGEQGCIDANGNYNIMRGFSLQDQNTQRQEMLLTMTGKPAVLIKRVQTGITCSCYLPSSEAPDDRCPFCFAEGTLVRAESGLIPIELINIGDKVLSADGKYHRVTEVFKTPFNGKLKAITTTTTTKAILATNDHPFLKLETDHKVKGGCGPNSNCKSYINRGDGQTNTKDIKQLPSGRWNTRIQVKHHKRITLGTFDTKEEGLLAIQEYKSIHSKPSHRLEWITAKNINKNDWLVSKWNISIIDIDKIEIPSQFLKNTNLGMARIGSKEFIVDEEFLWIIGIYIAEGSNNKRSIQFSLHENESDYQNKIISYFTKYGFNPKLRRGDTKGVVVEVSGSSLAKWFPDLCGKLCYNKKIPEQFMSLPDNKISAIIQGIWDGDGNKRENEIVQTSEKLCLQIAELLHRLGNQPLITQVKNNKLTLKGNKRKQAYRINWEENTFNCTNRRGRWKFYEQLLNKVKKIEEVDYNGHVYNLEVEGDHTYVVQNILVHNCYGTKFVFGYEQYFNPRRSDGRIMIRPGPTEENLKRYEAGMESEFPVDLWTLTVPTIKTRDILVMFDQDNNEEFRYEIAGVTRNNTILELQGGQHMKAIRIRKFDPAYQIRIFRDTSEFPSKLNTSISFVPGIPPHTHEIVINQNIISVNQINQTTNVVQGHNHPIIGGVVMTVLGHNHHIILP